MKITRKELDRRIKDISKILARENGYKTRGLMLFKKINQYFISVIMGATGINRNKVFIRVNIKPFYIDDIFWEVFQMSENSQEPMGLRGNGAFAVDGLEILYEEQEIENYDTLEESIKNFWRIFTFKIEEVLSIVNDDINGFISYSEDVTKPSLYDISLVKMLVMIMEQRYQEAKIFALEELENNKYGRFKNEGKYIYEHIVSYCDTKLKN